jgi:glycosyltransferase involved in cell wall biosynthesis
LTIKRVLYPFVGDTVGGSHLSTIELVKNLPKERYQSIVLLFKDGLFVDYLKSIGIDYVLRKDLSFVVGASLLSEAMQMLLVAPSLASFLYNEKIDIVHTNDYKMHRTWAVAARLAGCRLVWHQRTADLSRRNGLFSLLAHEIVTISNYCRNNLVERMSKKAEVIFNPFNIELLSVSREQSRSYVFSELKCMPVSYVVGFVGNIEEQKQPIVFLHAAKRIRDSLGEQVVFIMLGELRQEMTEKVKVEMHRLELEESIYMLGAKFPINSWIASMDLLLAPAINEGFGRAIVEAMLEGTIVVAADSGGHHEVLDKGRLGVLVPPEDGVKMGERALSLLLDKGERSRLVNEAKEYAKITYSANNHVKRITEVYDR